MLRVFQSSVDSKGSRKSAIKITELTESQKWWLTDESIKKWAEDENMLKPSNLYKYSSEILQHTAYNYCCKVKNVPVQAVKIGKKGNIKEYEACNGADKHSVKFYSGMQKAKLYDVTFSNTKLGSHS